MLQRVNWRPGLSSLTNPRPSNICVSLPYPRHCKSVQPPPSLICSTQPLSAVLAAWAAAASRDFSAGGGPGPEYDGFNHSQSRLAQ